MRLVVSKERVDGWKAAWASHRVREVGRLNRHIEGLDPLVRIRFRVAHKIVRATRLC